MYASAAIKPREAGFPQAPVWPGTSKQLAYFGRFDHPMLADVGISPGLPESGVLGRKICAGTPATSQLANTVVHQVNDGFNVDVRATSRTSRLRQACRTAPVLGTAILLGVLLASLAVAQPLRMISPHDIRLQAIVRHCQEQIRSTSTSSKARRTLVECLHDHRAGHTVRQRE
jgi:hypothetical protein